MIPSGYNNNIKCDMDVEYVAMNNLAVCDNNHDHPDEYYKTKLHSHEELTTTETTMNHTQPAYNKTNNAYVMLTT